MKLTKKDIVKALGTGLMALLLSYGLGISYASWSAPTATPPGNNTSAPINVGYNTQFKDGNLVLNASTTKPYGIGLQVWNSLWVATTTSTSNPTLTGLLLQVDGKAGATQYCDNNGGNCITAVALGSAINTGATAQNKGGNLGATQFCDQSGANCFTAASASSLIASGSANSGTANASFATGGVFSNTKTIAVGFRPKLIKIIGTLSYNPGGSSNLIYGKGSGEYHLNGQRTMTMTVQSGSSFTLEALFDREGAVLYSNGTAWSNPTYYAQLVIQNVTATGFDIVFSGNSDKNGGGASASYDIRWFAE